MLQSTDGRITRQHRYELFAAGDLGMMLAWLASYSKQATQSPSHDDAAAKRARAEHLAHQRGGLSKAASLLLSPPMRARNAETLQLLRSKHPQESWQDILHAREEATARLKQPPQGISRIQEVEDPFSTEAVSGTIRRGNPQSSPGPSGLRFSHLQEAMTPDLAEAISQLSRVIFDGSHLPDSFWQLHTSANLSAIGEKARPVACGDVIRRIIGGTFCRQYTPQIASHFEPLGQYGVSVPGGSELLAVRATLAHQQGKSVIALDARNAFNAMARRAILPALADFIPPAVPYALNVYGREPPKLLFKTATGGTETVLSSTGVQQGCNLGPLCYSAGLMPLLRAFKANPPVVGAQIMAFIDDLVVTLPASHATDPAAAEAVTTWLQAHMQTLGVELNAKKSTILFPSGTDVTGWPEIDRKTLERTQLRIAEAGMRIVGVPVGGPDYIRQAAHDIACGEPAALLKELACLEDAQASLQILRFSAATRLNFLLRALPPDLTAPAASAFDKLLEQTLLAIINGPGPPEEHPTPGQEAGTRLPVREGGLGLPSATGISGPAFIGGQALVL
ncbi:unnamed protein product, partial [Laminaria digitata]